MTYRFDTYRLQTGKMWKTDREVYRRGFTYFTGFNERKQVGL